MRVFLPISVQNKVLVNKVAAGTVASAAIPSLEQNANASGTQINDATASLANTAQPTSSNDASSQSSSIHEKQESTDNTSASTITVAPLSNQSPKLQRDDGNGNNVGARINATDGSNGGKAAQASTPFASESKYTEPKNADTSVVSEFVGDASSIRYDIIDNKQYLNSFDPLIGPDWPACV